MAIKETTSGHGRGLQSALCRFIFRLTAPRNHPLLMPLLAVGFALLICFVAIWLTGKDPAAGYQKMFMGGLGSLRALGDSSMKAAILTLTGLSVAIAFSTGLFNIGGEGQLVMGAITAAFIGQSVHPGTAWIHVPLALLCAAAAGALPALLAAWLKVRRGVHEVISTIMLNWTAVYLVEGWLVIGPLRARTGDGGALPGTAQIDATAELPTFFGMRSDLGMGIVIAIALAAAACVILRKTWAGFEMRACGDSQAAASASGIPVERRIYLGMGLSGACAGLAGAVIILGIHHQYPAVFRTGYGFDGVAVSLIGGNHPLGLLVAACFFGVIRTGGASLQLLQIHRTFPELIQGLALLFVAGRAIIESGLTAVHSASAPSEAVGQATSETGLTAAPGVSEALTKETARIQPQPALDALLESPDSPGDASAADFTGGTSTSSDAAPSIQQRDQTAQNAPKGGIIPANSPSSSVSQPSDNECASESSGSADGQN